MNRPDAMEHWNSLGEMFSPTGCFKIRNLLNSDLKNILMYKIWLERQLNTIVIVFFILFRIFVFHNGPQMWCGHFDQQPSRVVMWCDQLLVELTETVISKILECFHRSLKHGLHGVYSIMFIINKKTDINHAFLFN